MRTKVAVEVAGAVESQIQVSYEIMDKFDVSREVQIEVVSEVHVKVTGAGAVTYEVADPYQIIGKVTNEAMVTGTFMNADAVTDTDVVEATGAVEGAVKVAVKVAVKLEGAIERVLGYAGEINRAADSTGEAEGEVEVVGVVHPVAEAEAEVMSKVKGTAKSEIEVVGKGKSPIKVTGEAADV